VTPETYDTPGGQWAGTWMAGLGQVACTYMDPEDADLFAKLSVFGNPASSSGNHPPGGVNALYVDGHVEFSKSPLMGADYSLGDAELEGDEPRFPAGMILKDNIYLLATSRLVSPRGVPGGWPPADWDSFVNDWSQVQDTVVNVPFLGRPPLGGTKPPFMWE